MKWISVKDRIPSSGQRVRIKAHYDEIFEAVATFNLYDIDEEMEVWGWNLSKEDLERYGTLRPTHWMPLPEVPNEVD
jgi:hypothetical protein